MNLTSLTAADFNRIASLLERKEKLQAQAAEIDAKLAAFEIGDGAAVSKGKPGRKPSEAPVKPHSAKRAKRGAVKAAIVDLVKTAGASGITVKEVADRLGVGYNRVSTWFSLTGKNVKEIKKVGEAKYAWTSASALVAAPTPTPAAVLKPVPAPTPVAKPRRAVKPVKAKSAKAKRKQRRASK